VSCHQTNYTSQHRSVRHSVTYFITTIFFSIVLKNTLITTVYLPNFYTNKNV